MGYKVIEVELTDDQIAQINTAIGDNTKPFALLAQPKVRGSAIGTMKVYVCTAAQYKAIEFGVNKGRQMEEWS